MRRLQTHSRRSPSPNCGSSSSVAVRARLRAASRGLGAWTALILWLGATGASAHPGQGVRLGGVELQGPASRAVTALHHNPAMLAALRGSAVHVNASAGLEQLRVRRYGIDPDTGAPTGALGSPTSVLNPAFGYFIGASFYLDPVAIGAGFYDLDSVYRWAGADALRYHLAPDPDPGCLRPGRRGCPPNGGSVSMRNDLTLALAWNLGTVQLGAAVHFPRVRERFAQDNDTELLSVPEPVVTARCADKEDPACSERVGFKGWTHWIPRNGAPPGFDAALTFGVAFSMRRDTITFGARYRTFPLRRGGFVELGGVALVCRPEPTLGLAGEDIVPPCATAEPVRATLRERLPQQVAVGGSFVLGRSRLWRLDTNFYWMDLCPGGVTPGQCPDGGAQGLRLVGLARDSFVLPEFQRYRGLQDLYGVDIGLAYQVRSTIGINLLSNFSSPSVKAGAVNPAFGDAWRLGLSAGSEIQLRRSNIVLVPGYSIDMMIPRHVRPGSALFDPTAATSFNEAGRDINAPGAQAVLAGRARPTNAGRYLGLVHTVSLALLWGEAL